MKKYVLISVSLMLASSIFGNTVALGQTRVLITGGTTANAPVNCPNGGTVDRYGSCSLGYTPLEPIPGITPTNGAYDLTTPGGFSKFIGTLFTILISAGALIAVLSLTIGGIQYMTSSSIGNKTQGIDRARAAIYGIVLIAAIWLILNTLNPYLLNFNFIACPQGNAVCNTTLNPSNLSAASNASNPINLQGTTAVGPATLGTATGDQIKQVNSELGLTGGLTGGGLVSDKVLIYDPKSNSASNNAAINAYIDYCENSGVISTGSFGLIHYNVKPAYGGTFNAPGQNALVCVAN